MSWFSRLKNTIRRQPLDDAIDDEIRDHLERRAATLRNAGLSDREAQRQAQAVFGNARRVREDIRGVRTWPSLETTLQDIRYAARGLRRNPGFTVSALLSLTLAIGAITAIASVIDAAMLRPLPLPTPDQLFTLSESVATSPDSAAPTDATIFSYPAYHQLMEADGGRTRLALVGSPERVDANMPGGSTPAERVVQQFISGEALDILGVRPVLGRLFSSVEDRGPNIERVAVLSFAYWQRRFGEDPGVANRSMLINGRPVRILGVAARGFGGVEPGRPVDIWLPIMTFDPGAVTNPLARLFRIMGRLRAGEDRSQLQARLQAVRPGIEVLAGYAGLSTFGRVFGRAVMIVATVATLLLIIAVTNVASLLMGRATTRTGEMALRTSLGASRGRLVRQLLTESVLLSVLAGALGLAMAACVAPWLVTLLSKSSDPLQLELALNSRTLWFCLGTVTLCAVSFGLIPAWTASSTPANALGQIGGQVSSARFRRVFVGVQMAFAVCLVIVASAFLTSIFKLFAVATGFAADHVTVLTLRSDFGPRQEGLRMTQDLQRQIGMLSDVESVAVAWWAIFDGTSRRDAVAIPGQAASARQEIFYRVSPGYFATLKTPLLEGRDLRTTDTETEPIPTVVNRTFARTYFDDRVALGRMFQRSDGTRHLIVGVAADSFYDHLRRGVQPIAYFPMKPPRFFTMYVRSWLDPVSVMESVDRETRAMAPGVRVVDVTTLNTLVGNTLVTERLLAKLGSLFAMIGLVLAAIGAFGIVNYTVLQRTKEIGIRAALGASRRALIELVVKDFLWIVLGALGAGVLAAVGGISLMQSELFGVGAANPLVVVAAVAVFVAGTALAIAFPVIRASRIDPIVAVRHE